MTRRPLLLVALLTVGLQQTSGEVLPRYGAFQLPAEGPHPAQFRRLARPFAPQGSEPEPALVQTGNEPPGAGPDLWCGRNLLTGLPQSVDFRPVIPRDRLDVIASGPTVTFPTSTAVGARNAVGCTVGTLPRNGIRTAIEMPVRTTTSSMDIRSVIGS